MRRRSRGPSAVIVLATLAALMFAPSAFGAQTGSHNPVTAAPRVPRPSTPSCNVTLMQGVNFTKGYTPFVGTYAPPAGCPAPWSKVVLDWTGTVSKIQFDRIGAMWIGGVEVLRTSTPEPPDATITWTVAKDLSEYSSLLEEPQTVTVIVSNSLATSNPGVITITATLSFYETSAAYPAAPHPSEVIPVSSTGKPGYYAPWFPIPSGSNGSTITVPPNMVRAYLEVYATPHNCEEFWYSNQTTPWASTYGLCGGTAFREIQVFIDGHLAGVVWPFPIIYTGGLSPLLWEVVPGVNAFNIPAYVVNVTPFIQYLENSSQAKITFSVFNNSNYWRIDANLLVYTDPSAQTTSAVFTFDNTLYGNPSEQVVESIGGNSVNLTPDTPFLCPSASSTTCIFDTTASRSFTVAGNVKSSLGLTTTTVSENMSFYNQQVVNLAEGLEDLSGDQVVSTRTTTQNSSGIYVQTVTTSYPLTLASAEIVPTNERQLSFFEPNAVNQTLLQNVTDSVDGKTTFSSSTSDAVSAQAFLEGDLFTGAVSVAEGSSTEHYVYFDSTSACYNVFLASSNDTLTADVTSPTC